MTEVATWQKKPIWIRIERKSLLLFLLLSYFLSILPSVFPSLSSSLKGIQRCHSKTNRNQNVVQVSFVSAIDVDECFRWPDSAHRQGLFRFTHFDLNIISTDDLSRLLSINSWRKKNSQIDLQFISLFFPFSLTKKTKKKAENFYRVYSIIESQIILFNHRNNEKKILRIICEILHWSISLFLYSKSRFNDILQLIYVLDLQNWEIQTDFDLRVYQWSIFLFCFD